MTRDQANDQYSEMTIAALLTLAYQPPNLPADPIACETLKITQFERMYTLTQMAFDPTNQTVFPMPKDLPHADPFTAAAANPAALQTLVKLLAPILASINPALGVAAATVGAVLPAVALPLSSSAPK